MVGGDDLGQIPCVGVDQLTKLEQHCHPLGQGGIGPAVGGFTSRREGLLQILAVGQMETSGDLSGGRVEDVLATGSVAWILRSGDSVGDLCDAHALSPRASVSTVPRWSRWRDLWSMKVW